jgi:mono/diheme cytochrome c family protein
MVRLAPLLLLLAACTVRPNPPEEASTKAGTPARLEVATPSGTRAFTLDELRRAIPADTASVAHDPAYDGRAKRYAGFPLERLLALAGVRPAAGEVLYFVASDGYRATMAEPASDPRVRGIVAFADLDAGGGWEPVKHGASSISPGPFYLVWESRTAGDSAALARPWPYQLARIEVVDPRRKFDRIYPTGVADDDPVARGFRAFAIESHGGDQCVACHALNRQGGSVGPELNVPRNITEYRDEATLAAFIRNSRSFRAGSAMPVYQGRLSDGEIAEILAYLRWMRGHKVALDSTGAASSP